MRTVNDIIKVLKEQRVVTIPQSQSSIVPDLCFTLDVWCIPHRRRDVDSLQHGRQVRIELRNS
ncbi:hypothetical protein pEaSNUABM5_00327 [Erwinia phage pEa_SNUABM_5]|uniref:Uncharacterized protein n=1 Tax=Erwinia phage pEa_SNUABM_5 TaxID=2797313 RepID=A0A7T8IWC9_9CAUD|nr:hypothetical protein MPK73_gp327 [Erwinia phage pEa_SNUABM_5]QQO90469.1 hypothetical protein pEaSNUABM5_00327 [Erwinia phage pEa_SNUABM_5]